MMEEYELILLSLYVQYNAKSNTLLTYDCKNLGKGGLMKALSHQKVRVV